MSTARTDGLETLTLADCELKFAADGDSAGEIEGYASIFGELDQGNDIVVKGAYAKSLRERKRADRWDIPMFFGHAHSSVPIGVWSDFREDNKGLKCKGRMLLANSADARQVRDVILAGGGMGISIGYKAKIVAYRSQDGEETSEWRPGCARLLKELDLAECSFTAMPMCRGAQVTSAKSAAEIAQRLDAGGAAIRAFAALDQALSADLAMKRIAQALNTKDCR